MMPEQEAYMIKILCHSFSRDSDLVRQISQRRRGIHVAVRHSEDRSSSCPQIICPVLFE